MNTQLKYIKAHFKWLVVLTMIICWVAGCQLYTIKRQNYTELHRCVSYIQEKIGVDCGGINKDMK